MLTARGGGDYPWGRDKRWKFMQIAPPRAVGQNNSFTELFGFAAVSSSCEQTLSSPAQGFVFPVCGHHNEQF